MSDERDFFATNGFVVLKGVLDATRIADYRARGDRLVASDDLLYRDREDDADGFRHLIEMDPAFLPLIAEPRVLSLVLEIMGVNIHLSSSHLSHLAPCASPALWRSHWHSDIWGVEDDLGPEGLVRLGLKCVYFLTDHAEPSSGATLVVPGSHHLREPLRIPPFKRHPVGVYEPQLSAGDCLVFDMRLRHTVGINLSPETRRSILLGYTYKWVAPLDDLADPMALQDVASSLAADLIPRGYRVPGSGALEGFCEQAGLPQRPLWRIP